VAKLNHKNIITIYSVVEAPELAIVMELIEGTTLEGIIQERGHLDAACAKQTIIQCLQGLAHAHASNCIHRDIKPANIMVCNTAGVDWTIKLVDFGLAKLMESSMQTGTLCGTPAFMAPEVWANHKIGRAADLWSVGIVLFYIVSGRLPFPNIQQLITGTASAPALPLSPEDAAAHGNLVAVTAKALKFEVSERFASAEEMLSALSS